MVCLLHWGFYLPCVPDTFASNPQFVVRLQDVDDDADGEDGCTILVGLMQKDSRRNKRLGRDLETIGFTIYQVFTALVTHLTWDPIAPHTFQTVNTKPLIDVSVFPSCRFQNRFVAYSSPLLHGGTAEFAYSFKFWMQNLITIVYNHHNVMLLNILWFCEMQFCAFRP